MSDHDQNETKAEDSAPQGASEEAPSKDAALDTALDALEPVELKEQDTVEDLVDDVDIASIPGIAELRARSSSVQVDELLGYVARYQAKMEALSAKVVSLKESKRENLKKHRGSVIDLHNRMFKKLIETESEQKTELERTQDTVKAQQLELDKLRLKAQEQEAAQQGGGGAAEQFTSAQLQKYMDQTAALEKEVDSLKKQLKEREQELHVELMKHERSTDSHRKSISTLHTNMFKKLLDAEDEFEDKIEKLNESVTEKARLLQIEKMKNEQSDKLRRDSIQTVHNNMLTKLLDAQAEHDEKRERLAEEVKSLRAQLRKEVLKNQARADKHAEQQQEGGAQGAPVGGDDDDESDMSDLETEETQAQSASRSQSQSKSSAGSGTGTGTGKDGAKDKFEDLWDEADDAPEAEVERLTAVVAKLERSLQEEKEKNAYIEKQRKDSIHNLHNNMFQKLLDAEFEYEEEIERLHREKEELKEKIAFYEESGTSGGQADKVEVVRLRDEAKGLRATIEENKQRIFGLTQQLEKSELGLQNEQKQRRSSVSFLSKQMMAKLLEAEEENEEQKLKFKQKLQHLQKELEDSKEMSFNLEKTRRNSVTKVSQTMFHKLLSAEQTKKEMAQAFEARIEALEQQLAQAELEKTTLSSRREVESVELSEFRDKHSALEVQMVEFKKESADKERVRRESFSALQNSYWKKLLEAEDDHEEQIKALKREIVRLRGEMNEHKLTIEHLTASKLNAVVECDKQMTDLRRAVQVYNNQSKSSWF